MAALDDKLMSVASSIADGSRIDWAALQDRDEHSPASAVLAQLALVERVATFHRSTVSDSGLVDTRRLETSDPRTWGHFNILERVGSGSFGAVYRAKDTTLQSEVALKLLPPSARGAATQHDRLKEARLLARVRHPHVVAVHGADFIDGSVGIWMELIDGRTLTSLLKEGGPLGAREAALIGLDLCRALAAVHLVGLLHGDIKAHNVMRERGGRTVLMDFGTGKDLTKAPESGDGVGSDFAGTPAYLAPEVFAGQPRTKLADIYSLGVLLYHLVTDAYPVDGRTRSEIEEKHRRGDRTYLRDVRPDLPVAFIGIIERALARDPRERYQTAGAFEAELARLSGEGGASPEPSPRRWLAFAVPVAALVVAAIGYWAFGRNTEKGSSTEAAVSGAPVSPTSTYQIDVALYRPRGGVDERLRKETRLTPGDTLFAKVRVSVAAYVYIVNEDDKGDALLLFPLPGQSLTNPLPPGTTNRIPDKVDWQVTSAGGREHFLIFASPDRLEAFEQMFAALPQPTIGKPIQNARLSQDTIGRLRSVGGLVPAPNRPTAPLLTLQFTTPLGESAETARGLWVRQFTVDNPGR